MAHRYIAIIALALLAVQSTGSAALTVAQFSGICASAAGECHEHPILQAYVGGALDMLAALGEETAYIDKLYCKPPRELFDVPAIMRFMQAHQAGHAEDNAMRLVIRYFEENGGCPNDE